MEEPREWTEGNEMGNIFSPDRNWAGALHAGGSAVPKPPKSDGPGSAAPLGARSYEDFWTLWKSHGEILHRLSLRWLKGRDADAEDALSVTKLKAMSHFCSGTVTLVNGKAWLARLLYTTCMDIHRRRYREGEETIDLEDSLETVDDLAALFPSPEQRLLRREEGWHLVQLVDDLPQPWRQALVERCVHHKSYSTIAQGSGTTVANIRKRVQLARDFLRERL
jgi:RNA polymerase sigma factor (sigma-70 family)